MTGPMSGYDIKKRVHSALGLITNASYGTLYPTLHKLLEEQAVTVQEITQTGRPAKKVYRLTNRGQQEFLDWLKRPAEADQIRREFLLKLYLAHNLESAEVLALITARRHDVEMTQQSLMGDWKAAETPQERWVVDYSLALCNAEAEWLKQVETHIHQAESVYPPPEEN